MKIGIFGGCFNPPHRRHKDIADMLIKKKYVDKIIFVPTNKAYPKEDLASNKDRFTMLTFLIKNDKRFSVSTYEIHQPKTTYQTLSYFHEKYPNDLLYFICGSDNLKKFTTWDHYQDILKHYFLLVIPRNKDDVFFLRESYRQNKNHIIIANLPHDNLSSTMIRKAFLHKDFLYLKHNLEFSVFMYIKKHHLYD